MVPSALHVSNYRSFPEPQSLELRPLTLLYGHNSAGKSALVRLLPLLAESMGAEDSGPLNLAGAAARGSTFHDLRWKLLTGDESSALTIGLEWHGDRALSRAEFEIEQVPAWERMVVRRFRLFGRDGAAVEGRRLPRAEERLSTALTYQLTGASGLIELPIRFRGLVPEVVPEQAGAPWVAARERLLSLRRAVLWLGARQTPGRILARPAALRWGLLPDGSDVGELLVSQPGIREEVSLWCQQHLRRSVEIREVLPAHFRVTLQHLEKVALDVDLLDAGEGVLKVVPVLAALALGRQKAPEAPRILALEEPESHLHPNLQRALAEHIASLVAGQANPPCIVLETHSQHILLGVQIQVARGQLRPEQVQVYWVHQDEEGRSRAWPVGLDEEGRLKAHWPADVYSEVQDMAAELFLARQERRRS